LDSEVRSQGLKKKRGRNEKVILSAEYTQPMAKEKVILYRCSNIVGISDSLQKLNENV
jgi:hypothetical protein